MAITGQWKRRKVTINADAYISGATSNVPVLVKFNSTSHPDLFASGDDGDSVWFSSDAGGQTTLYHENVVFDTTDAIFWIKVDLSSTADTVIYFWYGQPAITGTENADNTWYNSLSIHHFYDTRDSSKSSGWTWTLYGSLSYNTDSLTGKSITGWSSSNYLSVETNPLSYSRATGTVSLLVLIKAPSNQATLWMGGSTSAWGRGPRMNSQQGFHWWMLSDAYMPVTSMASENYSTDWTVLGGALASATAYYYGVNENVAETNSTTSYTSYSYTNRSLLINKQPGASSLTMDATTRIDEVWAFSEYKNLDFYKSVYNNTKNYSSFVTIDGSVNIGSSPIQVYPVWATTQALTEDIGISSTSGVTLTSLQSLLQGISITSNNTLAFTTSTSFTQSYSLSTTSELLIQSGSIFEEVISLATTSLLDFTVSSAYNENIALITSSANILGSPTDFYVNTSYAVNSSLILAYLQSLIESYNLVTTSNLEFESSLVYGQSITLSTSSILVFDYLATTYADFDFLTTSSLVLSCEFGINIHLDTTSGLELIAIILTDLEEISLSTTSSISILEDEYIAISSTSDIVTAIISTGVTFIGWNIYHTYGGVTTSLYDENIIENATFTKQKGKKPNNFTINLLNPDGTYNTFFHVGDEIKLYLIYDDGSENLEFNGIITEVRKGVKNYDNYNLWIKGVDRGTLRLAQTLISGSEPLTNISIVDAITYLMTKYLPDITLNNVENLTDIIDNISFNWEFMNDAIEKLALLAGADYYIDVNNDLNFFSLENLTALTTIDDSKVIEVEFCDDYNKSFDRIYVVGGREAYLDVSATTTSTELNLKDYYYAVKFTPTKTNLLCIESYLKKYGNPLYDLNATIVEDNSGQPTGKVIGYVSFNYSAIDTTAAWVRSTYLNKPLDITKSHWIIFQKTDDSSNYYILNHDNTGTNKHYRSSDANSWTGQTGTITHKTYYGIQIVQQSYTDKIIGNYYTDLALVDLNIADTATALSLAQQMLIKYTLQTNSVLKILPLGITLNAGNVIYCNFDKMGISENQTIIDITYKIDQNKVFDIEISCNNTEDFYSAFSNLFIELRKLKIKNYLDNQDKGIDYLSVTETPSVSESQEFTEDADSDDEFDTTIWDVGIWA